VFALPCSLSLPLSPLHLDDSADRARDVGEELEARASVLPQNVSRLTDASTAFRETTRLRGARRRPRVIDTTYPRSTEATVAHEQRTEPKAADEELLEPVLARERISFARSASSAVATNIIRPGRRCATTCARHRLVLETSAAQARAQLVVEGGRHASRRSVSLVAMTPITR